MTVSKHGSFQASLDAAVSSVIVEKLLQLLQHSSELHRTTAAELLGKGYHVWRAQLPNPSGLIRTLFRLAAKRR